MIFEESSLDLRAQRNLCAALALTAMIALSADHHVAAQSAAELEARFFSEAPKAWEEYKHYVDRLNGTLVMSAGTPETGITRTRALFKSTADSRMVEVQYQLAEPSQHQRIFAFNSAYAFTLDRKSTGSSWLLMELELGANKRLGGITGLQSHERAWAVLIKGSGWRLFPDLLRQPNFRVTGASLVQRDGGHYVQIDFENQHPHLDKAAQGIDLAEFDPVQSGTLVLDPDHCWVLRSCREQVRYPHHWGSKECEIELEDPSARYLLPKRVVFTGTYDSDQTVRSTSKDEWEFNINSSARAPREEEFRLSAFGLPEPVGVPPLRRSHAWLWIILAGVGLLVLAVVFNRAGKWYKRQRQATEKGPA